MLQILLFVSCLISYILSVKFQQTYVHVDKTYISFWELVVKHWPAHLPNQSWGISIWVRGHWVLINDINNLAERNASGWKLNLMRGSSKGECPCFLNPAQVKEYTETGRKQALLESFSAGEKKGFIRSPHCLDQCLNLGTILDQIILSCEGPSCAL